MRTHDSFCGAIGRWLTAGAATLAAVAAAPTRAAEVPSLADAISFDAAELWSDGSGSKTVPAPLRSALYAGGASKNATLASAEEVLAPIEDGDVEPAECQECNGGGGGLFWYNRCGCSTGLWPYFTGPGACDTWCVGPHWEVAVDGLILFRENANWGAIDPGAGFTTDLIDQFEEGPGARVFVTGYNENNFGVQVGYEGINDFHANALYSNAAGDSRAITYESNFNSVEINFIRRTDARWRPFAGVRYIELDDDFVDFTTANRVIPPPSDPPAPPTAYVDTGSGFFIDNRMIGLQGGAFRDMWRLNRWVTIEPFGNAGVYLNDFKREQVDRTVTTIITGDDLSTGDNEFSETTTEVRTSTIQEFSELSFVGEAGVTGVFRLNRCVALRAGYQVLVMDRVGQGLDAFLAPGLNPTTLVYHGGHFGVEYVR
jgi:hypothetical protein